MTARWSGVLANEGGDAPFGRISKQNAGGFPTALGGQSPESVFSRRVLVSETSVVEADSKHLGGASKESRKAPRGAHRQATGRQRARTGSASFTSRKGATARRGRKAEAGTR
jgi:hypothetical protein